MPADALHGRWTFICSPEGIWSWRFGEGESGLFSSFDDAAANATSHGFDPFSHSWTSAADGRTTHYRLGKTPVNLPSDMELQRQWIMSETAAPFKFLSVSEFETLSPQEKRAYVRQATAEVERTKLDPAAGGWHTLFRPDQRREQRRQPRPQGDKKRD